MRVDLPGAQRVDERGGVGEVDDLHLVEIGLPGVPVVGVLRVHALGAGGEALQHERPGAHLLGVLTCVVHRHDGRRVLGQAVEERDGLLHELHLDRAVVDLGEAGRVEQRRQRRRQGEVGVEPALERVDHVIGGDRLAVVELDALLQPDDVVVGGDRLDLLGDGVLVGEVELLVVADERLPAGDEAGLVGLGDDELPVDDVVGAPDDADSQRAPRDRAARGPRSSQPGGHRCRRPGPGRRVVRSSPPPNLPRSAAGGATGARRRWTDDDLDDPRLPRSFRRRRRS